jgi:nucleoside phosphorylase
MHVEDLPVDSFDKYRAQLTSMARALPERELLEFQTLRSRLTEIIDDVILYGDTEQHRADRARVLSALNRLAITALGVPFDALSEAHDTRITRVAPTLDIVVYVALSEEFTHVIDVFGHGFEPREAENTAVTVFSGAVQAKRTALKYTVGIVPSGKMGITRAASVMASVLGVWNVKNIVVLGIAGAITGDLQPGDVFIPDSVSEYLANSAASGKDTLSFALSGNHFPTDPRLMNRFQLYRTTFPAEWSRWEAVANQRRASSCDGAAISPIRALGVDLDRSCTLLCGDDRILGSGPAVGKGLAFATWLKSANRKVSAVEMETAGVSDASFIRTPAPRTIAIRGISDYADERKEVFERASKGLFRAVAVRNAAALLLSAIELGLFSSETSDGVSDGAYAL